jgi:hypothetical protein
MVLLNRSANDLFYVKNNKKQMKLSFFLTHPHTHTHTHTHIYLYI